jgi:CBS-domain-containing membrane protein
VPAAQRATVRARDIAEPIEQVSTASPDELVIEVLHRVSSSARILVFERSRLVGIVTPTDLMRAVQRAQLQTWNPDRRAA